MLENLKYREKIILFIATVFLLIGISLFFIYSTSRKNLLEGHKKSLEKTAQLTIITLKYDVKHTEDAINLFKETRILTEHPRHGLKKELLKEVSSIIRPLNLSILALYDKNGNNLTYIDMDNPAEKEKSVEKLPYLPIKKIVSGFEISNRNLRILAIGPATYKPPSPKDIISYIKVGTIINTEHLNFIKEVSGNDIFIMKGNDVILSTQGVSSVKVSEQEMEVGRNRYSIKSIPLNSIYGKETGRFIIALSQKDITSAFKKLKFTILLTAFSSLVISGILGSILIRTLTSPLNRLIRFTGQVGSGKFPEETTFKGGDEVSVLGRHFLLMTKRLKDQKKALDDYTTGLEDAVMKRTEELLNSREEWVRTFDSITDYVLIIDHDHRIVRANKAILDKLDLTNQELSGKKCYEIFCGKNSLPFLPEECPIQETLTTGKPSIREIRYSKFDGYFLVTASPLIGEEDEITGAVYVIKDITEHHNMQIQMIHAEKLASLGQMAAGFAHEINNPIASIAGCSELLIDQLHSEGLSDEFKKIQQYEYFHDYLNIIYREAFRCKDIIRGMLRFSRRQFEKVTIDINSLLKEILLLLDHIIKSQKIHLVEDYRSNTTALQANEGEIRQIFLALIINAVDAMPDGGTLTIKTEDLTGSIRITVKDTGPGVPSHIRDKIFEPFFTTKPVGKGTGLGLFIAFNIVKNYQGKIELESIDSKGATFIVTLPTTTSTTNVT